MKIGKRDIGLLLMLVGIATLLLVYRFVYQPNMEKVEDTKAQTEVLKVTQADLAEMEQNMGYYQSEIARMSEEDEAITAHYPANILPENEIMYAVEMEENNEVFYSSLSYGTAAEMRTGYEDQTGIRGYDVTMSMTYQSTYQGLKDVILYTAGKNERMVINSVTASYDRTTGNLSGSMTLDQFYMTGTSNVYAEPYVPAMNTGMENIFGTIELPVTESAVEAETEAETEVTEGTEEGSGE